MKTVLIASCLMLLAAVQAPEAFAKETQETQEYRAEADQYYLEKDFKKAYKIYYKLAKTGDHYSQDQVSNMYVNGEGKSIDLTVAYAWSVLAAESGEGEMVDKSDLLLEQTSDKALAEKKAAKLKKKYGKVALNERAKKLERIRLNNEMGGCTGSRIGCS